jgi:HEPN domain-containing protein
VSYEAWIKKALRFREYAEEDLRGGRYDSAAFFAQQAAEFLLKGVLIKLTGSRPLTHAVSELLAYLAKALGRPVPEDVMRCAEALETHYIQARYPDARLSEYRKWEAEGAVKCMDAVWRYVREVAEGIA